MKPKYSICMCNYNMEDTLETSLTSILDQLDDRFEVLVVDDGSTDESVTIIKNLQARFHNLRLIALNRDRKRKLGLTRNISVQEAKGEYVLLHLDCDDVYDSFLIDFTTAFHQIENCMKKDVLLSGQHINIGKRSFLLKHGPYRNMFRGEDRDLWSRLATIGAYIPLEHVDFATRLPKTFKEKLSRIIFYTWDHLTNDFRAGATLKAFLYYEKKRTGIMSLKYRLIRLLMAIPAWFAAKLQEPLPQNNSMKTPEAFNAYREKVGGTYSEIMSRHGHDPDLSFLSPEAQKIFGNTE